jgi:hypothetical protein
MPQRLIDGTDHVALHSNYSAITVRVLPNNPLWDQGAAYGAQRLRERMTSLTAARAGPACCARPSGRARAGRPAAR